MHEGLADRGKNGGAQVRSPVDALADAALPPRTPVSLAKLLEMAAPDEGALGGLEKKDLPIVMRSMLRALNGLSDESRLKFLDACGSNRALYREPKVARLLDGLCRRLIKRGRIEAAVLMSDLPEAAKILELRLQKLPPLQRVRAINRCCRYLDRTQENQILSEVLSTSLFRLIETQQRGSTAAARVWSRQIYDCREKHFSAHMAPLAAFLRQHGLNPEEMYQRDGYAVRGAWIRSLPPFMRHEALRDGVQTIAWLERRMPGCAAYLRETCGIRVFGRYPREMLLAQAALLKGLQRGANTTPCLSVFNPIYDWNGAFYRTYYLEQLKREQQRHEGAFAVIFSESAAPRGLLKQMVRHKRWFGPLRLALFCAHADSSVYDLDGDEKLYTAELDIPRLGRMFSRLFADRAHAVVFACHLGAPGGLVEMVNAELLEKGLTIVSSRGEGALSRLRVALPRGREPVLQARFVNPQIPKRAAGDVTSVLKTTTLKSSEGKP